MIFTPKLAQYIKSNDTSNIVIYVYDGRTRKQTEISTQFYITPAEWAGSEVNKRSPQAGLLNPRIAAVKLEISNYWIANQHLTPAELKAWYEGPKEAPKSVIKYTPHTLFEHYIKLCWAPWESKYKIEGILNKRTRERLSEAYIAEIENSFKLFKKFEAKVPVDFKGVNEELYDKFVIFLRRSHSHNTIRKTLKHFKMVMDYGREKEFHSNKYKGYVLPEVKTQNIRLTVEEVEAIINLKLDDKKLIAEQERFQVAYNLLLRFGDSVAISENNIVQRAGKYYLSSFTEKTRTEIMLPIKNSVYEILAKNGFKIKAANYQSNKLLKDLGKKAGIETPVTVTEFKDGKKIETVYPKFELIETHTTRRSAARHLYDAKMDPFILQRLGGWKSQKQMLEYIDIDLEYAADKAAEHPFFE